jgi:hypothetical protein
MKFSRAEFTGLCFAFLVAATLGVAAQDPPALPPKAPPQAAGPTRLTIEVTGGDKSVPVENASVYVKYIEQRSLRKDKKVELNVKTNREGIARVPDAPIGRALIQIIADGWKTTDAGTTSQTLVKLSKYASRSRPSGTKSIRTREGEEERAHHLKNFPPELSFPSIAARLT